MLLTATVTVARVAKPLTKITSRPAQPVEPYTKEGWDGRNCQWLLPLIT
ncbi:MAG: hypothetical protein GY782_07355 [Gammaproteobacteria bacterium]|nr:hypothetical protein [Gammaproteobacteria bacterium]